MTAHRRIVLIDQARGLAALSVAWFHLTNLYLTIAAKTGSLGWLGVEAFFVISGFVIPNALVSYPQPYRWRDFPDFLARRMIRLEPPYIVSILLVLALNAVALSIPSFHVAASRVEFAQLMFHFLYMIPLTKYSWIQSVYWTLAYEFAFYVAMAVLFPFIGQTLRWPGRVIAAIVIALAGFGVVPRLVPLFVMGFAAFRLAMGAENRLGSGLMIVASAAVMIHAHGMPEATIGMLVAVALASHRSLKQIPGKVGSLCIWLGSISYSLYLVHIPVGGKVVHLGRRFVHGPVAELGLSLFALAISLAVAWVFCQALERPAIRLARRLPAINPSPEPETLTAAVENVA